jgi:hypothetical protein
MAGCDTQIKYEFNDTVTGEPYGYDDRDMAGFSAEELFGEPMSYGEIETAERAAECFVDVWTRLGEEDYIREQMPYIVNYYTEQEMWYVSGSMEEIVPGGVCHATFSKDGELLAAWGEE